MSTAVKHHARSDFPRFFPPRAIRILGAGRFGTIAAQRLSKRYPDAEFLVVDARREKLEEVQKELHLPVHEEDALNFLLRAPLPDHVWIVPAVPVHVAFQWILGKLEESAHVQALPVPASVDGQVPNPFRVEGGTLYPSFATFTCPDVCNEPDEICTYTKKPRPGNLFEVLEKIQLPGFSVVVVRSWQLAPGVGGYPAGYLMERLWQVKRQPGPYLIGTSCRCHGVMDALSW